MLSEQFKNMDSLRFVKAHLIFMTKHTITAGARVPINSGETATLNVIYM